MYRGETITTTVSGFPIPVSEIKDILIVFQNDFEILIQKTLKDCTVDGETLVFRLTQAESLQLSRGKVARKAVIITTDGTRLESCPSYISVGPTIKNEVME